MDPIELLRANIGDYGTPPAYSDDELQQSLDAHGGVEPKARVALLLPLWTEAAGMTSYTAGAASESLSDVFDQLRQIFEQAKADAAAYDASTTMAAGPTPVAIPVQVWY